MEIGRSDGCQPPLLHQLDNNKLAESCAIDGVVKKDATSPQHARDIVYHGVPGSNVLQHIAAIDNVERLVCEGQVVAVSRAIIDYQSLLSRMSPRCVERRLGWIDTRHDKAHRGKFFSEQSATAAHVQGSPPPRFDLQMPDDPPKVGQAPRVRESFEDVEKTVLVPPAVRQPVVDIVVDARSGSVSHRCPPACCRLGHGPTGAGCGSGNVCTAVDAPPKAIPATTTRITRMNAATSSR